MNLTKKQLFLLKEVLSKVRKNELTNKYTLYPEDYIFLNLNQRTMKMLERMCNNNNIEIIKLPKRLSIEETNNLFIKYNSIKQSLENNPTNKNELEQELIEIKHKIVLGHIKVMYFLINNKFPNFLKEQDSEDIYQIGYELLTLSVDKYDVNKTISFTNYIKYILIHRLSDEIWRNKRYIKYQEAREIISLLQNKDFPDEEMSESNITNDKELTEERINYLLSIINKTYEININELPYPIASEFNLEEYVLNQVQKDNLNILLEILPKHQKQVLKLYYGFTNNQTYTLDEISKILGYNNIERVRQIREDGLTTLSLPLYRNFISSDSENDLLLKERTIKAGNIYNKKREEEIIDTIINSISKDKISNLIEDFPPLEKNILELYYGLKDSISYNFKEISSILNITETKVKSIKRYWTKLLIRKINPNKQLLIQNYINNKSKKSLRLKKI